MSPLDPASATSIMARLRNEAKRTGETFNATMDRYVGFRLLYRLAESRYADQFMLKGATMFLFWFGAMHRPTRDLDLLGTIADIEDLKAAFIEVAKLSCPEDGVIFDVDGINIEPIREEQVYGGVRIDLVGSIGSARIPVQVDVGFGDVVTPGPQVVDIPPMIRDVPGCTMASYPVETALAEKLEAVTRLGLANSRMKDFFDLALLCENTDLDSLTLKQAIQATFTRRKTDLPHELPVALTDAFWSDATVQLRWKAFVRKNKIMPPLNELEGVCKVIAAKVKPILSVEG